MTDRVPVRRALLSVSNKAGLVELGRRLVALGVELVASGGTAEALAAADLPVTSVEDVTGSPHLLGGRVKTLHPKIHGGILADPDRPDHAADLEAHDLTPFELVVVNLYPFAATAADPDTTTAEVIEQIDIGGPTMVRAAAKNHARVAVVVDPADYDTILDEIASGGTTAQTRRRLAADAFFHTAAYDAAIVDWMHRDETVPPATVVPLRRVVELRYGENPHQPAGAYRRPGAAAWWADATQLQGKPLSFNNVADAEAAWRLASELPTGAAVVVKHTNPCGVAVAATPADAFAAAWDCDPLSAFGGIVAMNVAVDADTARLLAERFFEVLVAPDVDAEARDILSQKGTRRILVASSPERDDLDLRGIEGGALIQRRDRIPYLGGDELPDGWEVVGRHRPTDIAALRFAWTVAGHTKSNAVVVAQGLAAVGVGAGDQSRVGAAERAVARAGKRAEGSVAASDAFFPFRDGLDVLADAGVVAVVEPGGSKRDAEVIAAADERGIALVFTHQRHFRH